MGTLFRAGVASGLVALLAAPGLGQCFGNETQKLLASNGDTDDYFGSAVAMEGDHALIGAHRHDGVGVDSGAVYAFHRSAGVWSETQIIIPADAEPDDRFGYSISISGDLALIGAPQDTNDLDLSGSAYVYRLSSGLWLFEQKLTPQDEIPFALLGWSVAIDGDFAMAGTEETEVVVVFHRAGGVWSQVQEIFSVSPTFGSALDLRGEIAVIGAHRVNRALLYSYDGDEWVEAQELVPSRRSSNSDLGWSVATDGTLAVVGAPGYEPPIGQRSGGAFVFSDDGTAWTEEAILLPSNSWSSDRFGGSVAVKGDLVACGAWSRDSPDQDRGAVYAYRRNAVRWVEVQTLHASDGVFGDHLGWAVGTDGEQVLGGARADNDLGRNSGSAYSFDVPLLALDVNPEVVSTGDPFDVSSCGGQPQGPVLLAVVEIDGAPTFHIIAIARFNANGSFKLSGTVPPGLEGRVLTLQSMGRVDVNSIAQSQLASISIQ